MTPRLASALLLAAGLAACAPSCSPLTPATHKQPIALAAGAERAGPLAVSHGGVGSPPELSGGPQAAADSARARLLGGGSALDAAIAGTVVLEDDPRFNAGTGANIRLDGKTIQMDASLMTSEGRFAAVGVIERVRNPIKVVRAVMDTPHLFLAGDGATRFAHQAGFEDVVPTCPEAEERYRQRMKRLAEVMGRTDTTVFDWRKFWNFPNPMPADVLEWPKHGDTVGTVTRDRQGHFAATLSTGGTSITLSGRVGDVPVYGAGLYAGPAGAVACTGDGEEIIKRFMAHTVYERMARGVPARRAIEEAVRAFPDPYVVGIIAVDAKGWGVGANRSMAYGVAGE